MRADFEVRFNKRQTLQLLWASLKAVLKLDSLTIAFEDADMKSIVINGKLYEGEL